MHLHRPALALALMAGCSDRPTPVAVPVPARPVVEIDPRAEAILRQIAAQQKLAEPWWVRLSVRWDASPKIAVDLDRTPPGPDDYTAAAGGLKVAFARELLTYLRGSRIEYVETDRGVGVDVTFPNQDDSERRAASRWLREEAARHKAPAK